MSRYAIDGLSPETWLKILEVELPYIPEGEFTEEFLAAPAEWLIHLMNQNVLDYGAGYYHMVNLIKQYEDRKSKAWQTAIFKSHMIGDNTSLKWEKEGRMEMHGNWNVQNHYNQYLEYCWHYTPVQSLGEVLEISSKNNLLLKCGNISKMLWMAVAALQIRHHVSANGWWLRRHYNSMTKFARECGFIVHPDDDPEQGIIDFVTDKEGNSYDYLPEKILKNDPKYRPYS